MTKKSPFVYKEISTKKFNDKVTLVTGELTLKKHILENIYFLESELINSLSALGCWNSDTGKSILSEEDKFDEKTGIVLASRRAEVKLLKQLYKDSSNALKNLNDLMDLINEIKLKTITTIYKLEKSINKIKGE